MNLKLGKKAAKFNPYALRMSHYVDKTYIAPPFADHTPYGFSAWGMMMNDTLGDCIYCVRRFVCGILPP